MAIALPRHAIISGASSGIGEAICQRLLRGGSARYRPKPLAPSWQASGYQHRSIDFAETNAVPAGLEGLPTDAIIHASGMMRAAPLGALDPAVSGNRCLHPTVF